MRQVSATTRKTKRRETLPRTEKKRKITVTTKKAS